MDEKEKKKRSRVVASPNIEGKLPPQVIELEESVLGAIMLDKTAYDSAVGILDTNSFYKDAHTLIFKAMGVLYNKNEPIDLLTVTQQLRETGELELVGGAYYITQLTTRLTSAANVEFHARIVQEKYLQRELIKISNEAIRMAYEDDTDVFELIDETENRISNLTTSLASLNISPVGDVVRRLIKDIEDFDPLKDTIGTPTGFPELDKAIFGLQAPNVLVIAARPGWGKTVLGLNIADYVATIVNHPVAFFSYEMSKIELAQRFIASRYEIPLQKIRKKEKDIINMIMGDAKKWGEVMGSQLLIEDQNMLNIIQLKSACKKLKAKYGIKGIVVDYVQLIPPVKGDSSQNREQEIATISRGLKMIAKQLDIWVIELCQLSREVVKRSQQRPMLSDLRESGSLEQDADIVIFPYRADLAGIDYDEDGMPTKGKAEFVILKNRNGEIQSVFVNWKGEFVKFDNQGYTYTPDVESHNNASNDKKVIDYEPF